MLFERMTTPGGPGLQARNRQRIAHRGDARASSQVKTLDSPPAQRNTARVQKS